jgi:sugar phosphate isomerase/epimerase
MANTESTYAGGSYGFDSSIGASYGVEENYGDSFLDIKYRVKASQIGFPTDATTANQIQATSNKISSGTKTVEVSGLNIAAQGPAIKAMEMIPKPFFQEINRLKKLTGVDLTFHGPLVEPTGVSRQGWKEVDRQQAEEHMKHAVRRSHELDPQGNMVVTFHASNGLPEPETSYIDDNGKKVIQSIMIVNENTGEFGNLIPEENYLKGEAADPRQMLKKRNDETWFQQLQHVNFNVSTGSKIIEEALSLGGRRTGQLPIDEQQDLLNLYKKTLKGEEIKELKQYDSIVKERMNVLTQGDIYLRESYNGFQDLFNRAYKTAEIDNNKKDLQILEKFKNEIAPKIKIIEEDPSKVGLLSEELTRGIQVLRSVNTPQSFKELRPWAIKKSGTTFGNVAFDGYKKFEDTAPIISIENPPVGMGLSTAEDLREVVDAARKQFVNKAVQEMNMSRSSAMKEAEKLIGVTWDVGHINLLRGKGYDEKTIIKQTQKIAPYVKHVHLSDNFGMEHTELPMGMGNVPTKKMLDLIHRYNKKAKHIVETGDWYSRQGGLAQTQTPIPQTFGALGSAVYSNGGPYWNQVLNTSGGYFSGQGNINPNIHHSLYGAGFSSLPVELGGQMAGQSRVSGTPIE